MVSHKLRATLCICTVKDRAQLFYHTSQNVSTLVQPVREVKALIYIALMHSMKGHCCTWNGSGGFKPWVQTVVSNKARFKIRLVFSELFFFFLQMAG